MDQAGTLEDHSAVQLYGHTAHIEKLLGLLWDSAHPCADNRNPPVSLIQDSLNSTSRAARSAPRTARQSPEVVPCCLGECWSCSLR